MAFKLTRFIAYNESPVFGGQEKYLAILFYYLFKVDCRALFIGSPDALKQRIAKYGIGNDRAIGFNGQFENDDICLLNGNRALYRSLLRKKSGAWIYIQHSSYFDRQAGGFRQLLRTFLFRLALRRVNSVIRVCNHALPDSVALGRITTVHNGVDLEQFPCRTQWREKTADPFVLLMVGAVNPNKNQRLAIETLIHLPLARLVIVGDGPDRAGLVQSAQALGVADRVEWAGSQEDTSSYYRSADVYLMLSQFEAMPFVVLEAMASGTPVAGFPVGGVPEVVESDVDGVLIQERDPLKLAQVLQSLADDPARLRAMGLRARAKIECGFTAEHMVQGFLRVVDKICQGWKESSS